MNAQPTLQHAPAAPTAPTAPTAPAAPAVRSEKKRILYIDVLRIAGALAVICAHVCILILEENGATSPDWKKYLLLHAVTIYLVPLFLMISGMLLLNNPKVRDIGPFYSRSIHRIGVPLLFWSLVYYAYKYYTPGDILHNVGQFLQLFCFRVVTMHLWFLYLVIGLYLATPFISRMLADAKVRVDLYFVGISLGFAVLNNIIHFFWQARIVPFLSDTIFSPYVGYFVLGYSVTKIEIKDQRLRLPLALGFALGVFWTFLAGNYTKETTGKLLYFVYDPGAPNNLLMTLCLFFFFKSFAFTWLEKYQKALTALGAATYGIYLMHIAAIRILDHKSSLSMNAFWPSPFIGVPVTTILIFFFCLAVVLTMRKIPVLKYFVP